MAKQELENMYILIKNNCVESSLTRQDFQQKIVQKSKSKLITIEIAYRRSQNFGHILRLDEHVPANEAMR